MQTAAAGSIVIRTDAVAGNDIGIESPAETVTGDSAAETAHVSQDMVEHHHVAADCRLGMLAENAAAEIDSGIECDGIVFDYRRTAHGINAAAVRTSIAGNEIGPDNGVRSGIAINPRAIGPPGPHSKIMFCPILENAVAGQDGLCPKAVDAATVPGLVAGDDIVRDGRAGVDATHPPRRGVGRRSIHCGW